MSTAYIVEIRRNGGKDWRPVKAYLSKHAANQKAERCKWEDRVESRVVVCAEKENQ